MAAIHGQDFVQPDDVKRVAGPVLMHRMILRPESRLRKVTAADGRVAEVRGRRVPRPDRCREGRR